ncbi:MAG TPA: hypothetical protein VFD65_01415 [Chitinophagales bacterium]|nr:hypothetical protein [Chitinophagales bacterium]
MKHIKHLYILSFLLLLFSCQKDEVTEPIDYGYDYIVDDIGHYIIYQVDSTIYNDFDNTVRDTSLQFKEIIVEVFEDVLGREAHRVERYERKDSDSQWVLTRTYYFVKGRRSLEKIEENLRFVSFVFPPNSNLSWDGNRYIEAVDNVKYLSNWEYKYISVDAPSTILGKDYSQTAEVLLVDKENAIEKTYAKEIYAREIGMVYKEWWHLETQKIVEDPWLEKAEKGYILKMQIIDYGQE